ncbi:hypothetical protein MNV49_004692 [Pseudohyphozyma bogoriensis]|nr:hypothetical protein MNV49_004692 [Pseudohyphozyma bogoriensis]
MSCLSALLPPSFRVKRATPNEADAAAYESRRSSPTVVQRQSDKYDWIDLSPTLPPPSSPSRSSIGNASTSISESDHLHAPSPPSASPTIAAFPTEIFLQILGEILEPRVLAVCCQVSSSFYAIAREFLYAEIWVAVDGIVAAYGVELEEMYHKPSENVTYSLISKPFLATYVRRIHLSRFVEPTVHLPGLRSVQELLNILPNLQHVHIHGLSHPQMEAIGVDYLRTPRGLLGLHLVDEEGTSPVPRTRSIQQLSIGAIDNSEYLQLPPAFHLQKLTIDGTIGTNGQKLDFLTRHSLTSLTHLRFACWPRSLDLNLEPYHSLAILEIEMKRTPPNWELLAATLVFPISTCRHLTELRIITPLDYHHREPLRSNESSSLLNAFPTTLKVLHLCAAIPVEHVAKQMEEKKWCPALSTVFFQDTTPRWNRLERGVASPASRVSSALAIVNGAGRSELSPLQLDEMAVPLVRLAIFLVLLEHGLGERHHSHKLEIFEQIFSEIREPKVLAVCCRVSRSFYAMARQILYSEVWLRFDGIVAAFRGYPGDAYDSPSGHLARALVSKPYLATLVHVHLYGFNHKQMEEMGVRDLTTSRGLLGLHLVHVEGISPLPRTPTLQQLSIGVILDTEYTHPPPSFPLQKLTIDGHLDVNDRRKLTYLIRHSLASLTHLRFNSWPGFMNLSLDSYPALTVLEIEIKRLSENWGRLAASLVEPIRTCRGLVELRIMTPFNSYHCVPLSAQTTMTLFNAFPPTLELLHLCAPITVGHVVDQLKRERWCPALRRLVFQDSAPLKDRRETWNGNKKLEEECGRRGVELVFGIDETLAGVAVV